MKKKLISVIIPIFNEYHTISIFINKLSKIISSIKKYNFEIIFINDGSSDKSLDLLLNLKKKFKNIVIIDFSRNFGKESALTAGIDLSKGQAVIPIDVDLQDPPELITKMIKKWETGSLIVAAKRINRKNDNFFKRNSANFFYYLMNLLSNVNISKNVGDFRIMDRVVVDDIKKLNEKNRFMKGLFAWPGYNIEYIEYKRERRVAGSTKFNFFKLTRLAIEGLTSFSTAPLKIISLFGFFGIICSFVLSLIIIYQRLFTEYLVSGYAFLAIIILFFGSVQIFFFGIVGEYIGKIYFEVKNRPHYLIKKIYK